MHSPIQCLKKISKSYLEESVLVVSILAGHEMGLWIMLLQYLETLLAILSQYSQEPSFQISDHRASIHEEHTSSNKFWTQEADTKVADYEPSFIEHDTQACIKGYIRYD